MEDAPISGRARSAELKALWLSCLAVALLVGATAFMAHLIRPRKVAVSAAGFDLDLPAAPVSAPAAPVTPRAEPPAPQPAKPAAPAAEPQPAPRAALAMASDDDVRSNPFLLALLAKPASYIAQRTLLGKPPNLRGFLADPRRVTRYLRNPVIRAVLSSPALLRLLVRPAVIRAFVGSAAMGDAATVRALAGSDLVRQLARAPGVQEVLQDPAFVNQVLLDPETMRWLASHPEAIQALGQFGPAFAAASAAPR